MSMGSVARNKFVDTWEMILHAGNRELNFPDEWSEAWFDVQTFAAPQSNFTDKKLHPTQKPEGLIERLIEFGSYPDDHIIDPFCGSGTTGMVCPDDRQCTLIELQDAYVSIAEARLGIKRYEFVRE
jgi:DNA modification methylase